MQDNQQVGYAIDTKRPLAVRALRRSNVRKKITEYLFDISPSGSYTSEIAYHTKTTPTNVLGALRGMGTRYKKEESLLNLHIIEQINDSATTPIKIYRITEFGKELIELTKDRQ